MPLDSLVRNGLFVGPTIGLFLPYTLWGRIDSNYRHTVVPEKKDVAVGFHQYILKTFSTPLLYHLSYFPNFAGLTGLEPATHGLKANERICCQFPGRKTCRYVALPSELQSSISCEGLNRTSRHVRMMKSRILCCQLSYQKALNASCPTTRRPRNLKG